MNIKRILFIALCVLLATVLILTGLALAKVGKLFGFTQPPTPVESTVPSTAPTEPEATQHVHDYVLTETIDATCDGYGWKIYTCQTCEHTHMPVNERTDPLGHNYEVTTVTEATCTEGGFTEYTCSRCGRKDTPADAQQQPLGHDFGHGMVTEATCTEGGSTKFTCQRCGIEEKKDITEALGHQFDSVATFPATCTEDAYTLSTCTRCGFEEKVIEVGTATNHSNTEIRNEKSATETEDGYTGDKYCKDCNTLLEAGEVIPKQFTISSYDCQTSIEQSLFAGINAYRAENGLLPYTFDSTVHEATHIRVNEFIYREIHGVDVGPHNRLDGASYDTVFEEIGLGKWPFGRSAEIIAAASRSDRLLGAWQESSSHNAILLDSELTHIGLCVVYNNGTYYAVAIAHNNQPPQVMN